MEKYEIVAVLVVAVHNNPRSLNILGGLLLLGYTLQFYIYSDLLYLYAT